MKLGHVLLIVAAIVVFLIILEVTGFINLMNNSLINNAATDLENGNIF